MPGHRVRTGVRRGEPVAYSYYECTETHDKECPLHPISMR